MHLHEVLAAALARFEDTSLLVAETGAIRGESEAARIGDGWSTVFFAEHQKRTKSGYSVVSIDLDVSVADRLLRERGLREYVMFAEGHSIDQLARIAVQSGNTGKKYDIVFLDSDNDSQLILHEFLIANRIIRPGGLIIIDDVRLPGHAEGAHKGDRVLPWVRGQGWKHQLAEREGWNGYKTGVLIVER